MYLDVREQDEWDTGHVAGSVHVPMSALVARIAEVPRDVPLTVVCRVGARSAQVAAYLRQQGWADVENLDGGLVEWVRQGNAVVRDDGSAGVVA